MSIPTSEFLFEIGTEEIPARMAAKAAADLGRLFEKELAAVRLAADKVETYCTPRRLVLHATGIPVRQEDRVTEKKGPARKVAFDGEGNPTKAGLGFARSQGLELAALETVDIDGTEYLFARKEETGAETMSLLPGLLESVLGSVRFPKSMRWGSLKQAFVRPVHWLLPLFGDAVVPLEFADVKSSNHTFGHRFMGQHGPLKIKDANDYSKTLEENHVVFSPARRKEKVREESARLAASLGLELIEDEALLDEVVHLVEYPVVAAGGFDEKYLVMPAEVLITSMAYHQKFFAFREGGKLANRFLVVNNTQAMDMGLVVRGNERVLAARLEDALFFFNEDRKKELESFVEDLSGQTFLAGLGSMKDKSERLSGLAGRLAEKLFPAAEGTAERAGLLCKADLATAVVGEFPSLQGIMGREYAAMGGEEDAVPAAIFEHYLPRFAGDELPASDAGLALALADRLDTLVGCYSLGLVPTATKDPYALRRAALACVRMMAEKGVTTAGLSELVGLAVDNYGDVISKDREKLVRQILAFVKGRLRHWLAGDHSTEMVDACLAPGFDFPYDVREKVLATEPLRGQENYEDLILPFKRVINITRDHDTGAFDPALAGEPAEVALWEAFVPLRKQVVEGLAQRDFKDVLNILLGGKKAIDRYFDEVMVMCDDEAQRANRLAMLAEIGELFLRFADFTKILA